MDDLFAAIAARDIQGVLAIVLERGSDRLPEVRLGFHRECLAGDFKAGLPGLRAENDLAWCGIAADLAAFHNARGGVLFFGIEDDNHRFVGTRDVVDAKRFNDKVRRYLVQRFVKIFTIRLMPDRISSTGKPPGQDSSREHLARFVA